MNLGGLLLGLGRQHHSLHGERRPVDGLRPGELAQQVFQVRGGRQVLLLDHGQRLRVASRLGQRRVIENLGQLGVLCQSRGSAHQCENRDRGVPAALSDMLLELDDGAGQGSLSRSGGR